MAETSWIGQVVSVFVGGMIGLAGIYITSRTQTKRDKDNHNLAILEQRFRAYNKIIEATGAFHETQVDEMFGEVFNFDGYQEMVRPNIYQDFHLLDVKVKVLAKKLDVLLLAHKYCNEYSHNMGEDEHDQAILLFRDLVKEVEMIVWKEDNFVTPTE